MIKKFNTKINQYVLDLINKEDDISLNEDVANILQDAILNLTEKIISSYAQNQRDKLFGEINIKFTGKIISLAHNNNFFKDYGGNFSKVENSILTWMKLKSTLGFFFLKLIL